MPHSPIALFLMLVAVSLVAAWAAVRLRARLGFRANKWTYLGWALVAAVVAYFLIQAVRHP